MGGREGGGEREGRKEGGRDREAVLFALGSLILYLQNGDFSSRVARHAAKYKNGACCAALLRHNAFMRRNMFSSSRLLQSRLTTPAPSRLFSPKFLCNSIFITKTHVAPTPCNLKRKTRSPLAWVSKQRPGVRSSRHSSLNCHLSFFLLVFLFFLSCNCHV